MLTHVEGLRKYQIFVRILSLSTSGVLFDGTKFSIVNRKIRALYDNGSIQWHNSKMNQYKVLLLPDGVDDYTSN